MTTHRFIAGDVIVGSEAAITGPELHHLRRVLRLRPGDHVVVSDRGGAQFAAVLVSVDSDAASAKILASIESPGVTGITLFQALLKRPKMDLVVGKATELGVAEIVPLLSQRSVVRLDGPAGGKIERWNRIAAEASMQSGRSPAPIVAAPATVDDAASRLGEFEASVVFWEQDRCAPVAAALENVDRRSRVAVFVGPEGGFTQAEVRLLTETGAACAGLGPLTLRSETAAIAGLAIVTHELGRER